MRILLVEDEPDLGRAIQQSLSREKYIVDWVQNATDARDYLDNQQVHDTVATFAWLPSGVSGLELASGLGREMIHYPF